MSTTTETTAGKKKTYTLRSFDNESFEVDEAVAMMSQTIKHIIEDGCSDNGIPLPNVSSTILAKIIEYCKKHVVEIDGSSSEKKTDDDGGSVSAAAPADKDDLKEWDKDFVKVDQKMLFDIILAANYLDIKGLLDLTCQTVADLIKGKMPEEVRQMFNIKNDFTPEEEETVRLENLWAFE